MECAEKEVYMQLLNERVHELTNRLTGDSDLILLKEIKSIASKLIELEEV